ncbi:unnamed protein product [Mycena citricolor]|uniref:DUF6535 domain-containing protein n=1 Tax=Mycena citricolor TaxID=2018698 RepID=A0AAD2JVX1_9AGAR|nr:unnamed protein product [Mycena citricolor]
MSQADTQQTNKRQADEASLEREKASGNNLWSVYISEAEKYDQGLIDGWRSEMDGLLIFAGLFSGVVTTFIIESYKTLSLDSGSQTLALLAQISRQLANMNNGTAVPDAFPPPAAFSPPLSSLICNTLWFTSLALSLSSALVATLVEQWAREYHHRTTMFSSPSIRSRVYMYLYYGLRRFNMHLVVGIPPLLLHASLVLFFAGLVAFLVPINIIIMGICSALLFLFVSVYGTFSALPLFFFDCPYQTPLTRILWSLKQTLGSVLKAYIWKAAAVWKAYVWRRTPVTDAEKAAQSTATNSRGSVEPSAPADSRPQSRSMLDALKSAALRSTVETETRALAWTVRSLSDDQELEPFVEGLPQALWDFKNSKPRSVYQAQFMKLLRDPQVQLSQRLTDFMAGCNSHLLEAKDRHRRQLSVLRAIWAVCAFSLHTGFPLRIQVGEAEVEKALLSLKFLDSPDVQTMIPDVSALIRLNMIEFRRREWAPTQPCSSDSDSYAEAEKQRQAGIHRTFVDYLLALSQCAASFQREATTSLFHRSQMHFTAANGYETLQDALRELIRSDSDNAADNVVFAARQMITPFAQTSEYPKWLYSPRLGPFLARHPSLAASGPKSDSQPDPKHHYTRVLCHWLCDNLTFRSNPQPSVDALQLLYQSLFYSYVPPRDFDTHLYVLRALRTEAAKIRTHRLAFIVQRVALTGFSPDSSEWERLLGIFEDEDWFRSVLGLDNDKRTERASAQHVYDCAYAGVLTTFFEQCTALSSDQTERDLDWSTLELVHNTAIYAPSVIPTGLQRRFADAASEYIHIYPKDCLADWLGSAIYWAVDGRNGWIQDLDALRVLDTAVLDVQTGDQQQEHQTNAQFIRERMQDRLHPEYVFAAFVSLVSDGE